MVEGYEALKVEIDNIKEDIKEIKEDQKETKEYFRNTIEILKENSIRQTEILNNQEKQFAQVNSDIAELKIDIDATIKNQKVDIVSVLKFIAVGIGGLILGYIGMKLGIKQ